MNNHHTFRSNPEQGLTSGRPPTPPSPELPVIIEENPWGANYEAVFYKPQERGPGQPVSRLSHRGPSFLQLETAEPNSEQRTENIKWFLAALILLTFLLMVTLLVVIFATVVLHGVWVRIEKLDTLFVCLANGELDRVFVEIGREP